MKYFISNWKSNFTVNEAQGWIDKVKPHLKPFSKNLTVVICPAPTQLYLLKQKLPQIILGAQSLSPFPDGPYTGAISARMLQGLVEYAIVGHSERRRYFAETNQIAANQAQQALENMITPIIAVDRTNWRPQLNQLTSDQISRCLVMYEPPEAISQPVGPIGTGEAAPLDEIIQVVTDIRQEFNPKGVIYGGSVKSANISEFLQSPVIDGVLPGSASLDPEEWLKMLAIANNFA